MPLKIGSIVWRRSSGAAISFASVAGV